MARRVTYRMVTDPSPILPSLANAAHDLSTIGADELADVIVALSMLSNEAHAELRGAVFEIILRWRCGCPN
jgi:hypothetical protein